MVKAKKYVCLATRRFGICSRPLCFAQLMVCSSLQALARADGWEGREPTERNGTWVPRSRLGRVLVPPEQGRMPTPQRRQCSGAL